MKITLNMSAFAESIETQLNNQGVTCGKNAERYEKEKKALVQLMFADVITDGEYAKIEKRMFKRFTSNLKYLEKQD